MKMKNPFQAHMLLCWIAIISLIVSTSLYVFLGKQAEIDVHIRHQRIFFPFIGLVIAGICLIVGTAGRWFYPK